MRLKQRRRVDFPQPDGPIRAVTFRSGTSTDTSSRALVSPYHRLSLSVAMMVLLSMGSPVRVFLVVRPDLYRECIEEDHEVQEHDGGSVLVRLGARDARCQDVEVVRGGP